MAALAGEQEMRDEALGNFLWRLALGEVADAGQIHEFEGAGELGGYRLARGRRIDAVFSPWK